MKDRIRIAMWKICIWILAFLLVLQVGILLVNLQGKNQEEVLHFQALGIVAQEEDKVTESNTQNQAEATPAPTPFVLTNFDRIRVVVTNKEDGSIYHEDKDSVRPEAYRGEMEVLETLEGYVFINDLPIEEYLYSVVPSEMPSGYPLEALKAQAICARTYAYLHILSPGYPQWNAHVDDTTAYQVYHNVDEQESTTRAVNETQGVVLLSPDKQGLASTYYYSTSCGIGSDAHVWRTKYADNYPYVKSKRISDRAVPAMVNGTVKDLRVEANFAEFICTVHEDDFEANESWYRWEYSPEKLNLKRMLKTLQSRYLANEELILTLDGSNYVSKPIEELDVLVDLVVDKRSAGGVADELLIITEKNVYKVITELNIRYVLNDGETLVKRQDGTQVSMNTLLPSAFFILENKYKNGEVVGYHITGGGFGHGAGMSQNAAKAMALEGYTAQEILAFFFEGCTLEKSE